MVLRQSEGVQEVRMWTATPVTTADLGGQLSAEDQTAVSGLMDEVIADRHMKFQEDAGFPDLPDALAGTSAVTGLPRCALADLCKRIVTFDVVEADVEEATVRVGCDTIRGEDESRVRTAELRCLTAHKAIIEALGPAAAASMAKITQYRHEIAELRHGIASREEVISEIL